MTDTTQKPTQTLTAKAQVIQAVRELYAAELLITRDALVRVTKLKTITVDESLKALKLEEKIVSVERGVYMPVEEVEEAEIPIIIPLPRGGLKIEVGNQVVTFSARTWRMVAPYAYGEASNLVLMENNRNTFILNDKMEKLKRKMAALEARLATSDEERQGALDLSGGAA